MGNRGSFIIALLAVVALAAAYPASGAFGDALSVATKIAIALLFCASKKSLASGLPMALVFFGPGAAGLIMLPLIIFHQTQLLACAAIASRMSRAEVGEVSSG